jgi:glycosyltransferase involved in cell wall biosynthesis
MPVHNPLISIVLPTYNGEHYITKAIESCLNQTYSNIELIIVNDGSTDNTLSIAQSFELKDKRVHLINNHENLKLPKSLNIGFKLAKGDFFTWTSDDNIYSLNAMETLSGILNTQNDVDIVYSSYKFIDQDGKVLEIFGGEPEQLIFSCVPGACFLYKNKVHNLLDGYSENKFRMEDMDFWLRAAKNFRFKYINQNDLYYYRKHIKSLTYSIYSDSNILSKYRYDYHNSFKEFFNGLHTEGLTDEEINMHIDLFFEDLSILKSNKLNGAASVVQYVRYLDKLKSIKWSQVNFRSEIIEKVIESKRDRILTKILNDLTFENKILAGKNPKLAANFERTISWYYKEYEVLPGWYKKVGHAIKAFQGNKLWNSLISKKRN